MSAVIILPAFKNEADRVGAGCHNIADLDFCGRSAAKHQKLTCHQVGSAGSCSGIVRELHKVHKMIVLIYGRNKDVHIAVCICSARTGSAAQGPTYHITALGDGDRLFKRYFRGVLRHSVIDLVL